MCAQASAHVEFFCGLDVAHDKQLGRCVFHFRLGTYGDGEVTSRVERSGYRLTIL